MLAGSVVTHSWPTDRGRTLRNAFLYLKTQTRHFRYNEIGIGGEHAMDYADWKLFIDAAELGSLSKVALAYGTSQPHISRQISELEQECGGRLFQRTGRGVVLTELGQRIAPKVRAWLASSEQLLNDVRSSAGTPIGKVRIGSLPSTAHPLGSTLYKRLKERYPLVQLSVREGQGAQLETWLEDGSVDLAILYRTGSPRHGDTYLVETSTYLVSAAGDPLTARPTVPFSALHNLPLVLFSPPSAWATPPAHPGPPTRVRL